MGLAFVGQASGQVVDPAQPLIGLVYLASYRLLHEIFYPGPTKAIGKKQVFISYIFNIL
jgi:hypothetical protein